MLRCVPYDLCFRKCQALLKRIRGELHVTSAGLARWMLSRYCAYWPAKQCVSHVIVVPHHLGALYLLASEEKEVLRTKMRGYPFFFMILGIAGLLIGCSSGVRRTDDQEGGAAAIASEIVSVNNIVFPSAIYGTAQDPLEQVEEVVEKTDALLAKYGLGIGNMLQHTIFVKDGAASPIDVLERFHATATRLAPSLKEQRSVGTIIRVPELFHKEAVIMLDLVAGVPLQKEQAEDGYRRIPFTFGPEEIAETIGDEKIVFTAGLEAMDFEHGTLAQDIENQIVAIVGKLDTAMKSAGLSLSHMVQHNLYVTKGTDPMRVIQKFHEEVLKHDPQSQNYPSTGALMVVDGMAAPGFLLEMDAVAAKNDPGSLERVLFTETEANVAKAVSTDDLVYVAAMPGADFSSNMEVPEGIDAQVELAVKNLHNVLQQAGLSLDNIVKHRLVLKNGAADPAAVRTRFYEAAGRYAPDFKGNPGAETFLIVEGLPSDEQLFAVVAIASRR